MSVKINSLEVENVKRVKAVQLEPKQDGLTVIGGGNYPSWTRSPGRWVATAVVPLTPSARVPRATRA